MNENWRKRERKKLKMTDKQMCRRLSKPVYSGKEIVFFTRTQVREREKNESKAILLLTEQWQQPRRQQRRRRQEYSVQYLISVSNYLTIIRQYMPHIYVPQPKRGSEGERE